MLASKSKSGLMEASGNKTPRGSKLKRAGSGKSDPNSPSPMQTPRLSADRSPAKPVDTKGVNERRLPKKTSPPEVTKPASASDLKFQLDLIHGDLAKAKEQIVSLEAEKNLALVELNGAKGAAEAANEKLQDALAAQKRAEECLEIEKFRADELEQANIIAAQKMEEDWRQEVDSIRNQHAVDVSALLSATQELENAKQELTTATESKSAALIRADDAMRVAETNAEKADVLSGEVGRLKALLDSLQESKSNEAAEMIRNLSSEVAALTHELNKAKAAEGKLMEMEGFLEGLRFEANDAKKVELVTRGLADEWQKKAESLEARLEEATMSEKSSLDSLVSVRKQFEEQSALLQDLESEVAVLEGKCESLDIEADRYKEALNQSNHRLDAVKQDVLEKEKEAELLNSKFLEVEKEKQQALSNEKAATSNAESLSVENKKLAEELEIARNEGDKAMKAMEGLASALDEASMEARNARDRLSSKSTEAVNANSEIEELKSSMKSSQDIYEAMLGESKCEIDHLKNSIKRYETEANDSKAEWGAKEAELVNVMRRSEEEAEYVNQELARMSEALKSAETDAQLAKEDGVHLLNKLMQAESEKVAASNAVEEAKAESSELEEKLLVKENELQNIIKENHDLRVKEAAAQKKIDELSDLLEEATAKTVNENESLLDSLIGENDYEVVPISVEEPKQAAFESIAEKAIPEGDTKLVEYFRDEERTVEKEASEDAIAKGDEVKAANETKPEKESSSEKDRAVENADDDTESKMDAVSVDHTNASAFEGTENGSVSPTKQLQQKKKALLQKFTSMLKKKSSHK